MVGDHCSDLVSDSANAGVRRSIPWVDSSPKDVNQAVTGLLTGQVSENKSSNYSSSACDVFAFGLPLTIDVVNPRLDYNWSHRMDDNDLIRMSE
jgi:hypothetical protein